MPGADGWEWGLSACFEGFLSWRGRAGIFSVFLLDGKCGFLGRNDVVVFGKEREWACKRGFDGVGRWCAMFWRWLYEMGFAASDVRAGIFLTLIWECL